MPKPQLLLQVVLLSSFLLLARAQTTIAEEGGPSQGHSKGLFAKDTHNDRLEERTFDTFVARIGREFADVAPSLHLRLISDKRTAINDLFTRLHVNAATPEFFASEQYQTWSRLVLDAYEDPDEAYSAVFAVLNHNTNAFDLVTAILHGRASETTKAVANKLNELQIRYWVATQEVGYSVFSALRLNGEGANVFQNPLLDTYLSFARQNARYRTGTVDELAIIDELYQWLKHDYGISRLVEMLGAPQVDRHDGTVADQVMKRFFLDVNAPNEASTSPLEYVTEVFRHYTAVDSSAANIWFAYARSSLANDDYKALITNLLMQAKKNDKALATIIEAAQDDATTARIATKALRRLIIRWKRENKSTADVLQMLQLDSAEGLDMLKKPLVETWFTFESHRNANPQDLFKALSSQLTEEQVASMLVMKTKDPNARRRLDQVREVLFYQWHAQLVTEDAAFIRLQLHKAGNHLFTHPALDVWYWYVYRRGGADPAGSILRVVQKYYTDHKALLDMVQHAVKSESMIARSIASMLEVAS